MYDLDRPPSNHADKELVAAAAEPSRILLGIVRRLDPADPGAGAEMIGFVDFRLDWPDPGVVISGCSWWRKPCSARDCTTQAWSLLAVAGQPGGRRTARTASSNSMALKFQEAQGFTVTGESNPFASETSSFGRSHMQQPLASG